MESSLKERSYKEVQDLSIVTSNSVYETVAELHSQDNAIADLNTQNKVLVENTISGQKLALTICKINHLKKHPFMLDPIDRLQRPPFGEIKRKVFQKWLLFNKQCQSRECASKLKSDMEIIVNLRLKIKELDIENQELVIENEQLRKTSMDGIYLAQTWKELSEKVKSLSVDVTNKSGVIKGLVDENYSLASNIDTMRRREQKPVRYQYH